VDSGFGLCSRADEGRIGLNVYPELVCRECGSDEFKPDKLTVCLRDFDGAIRQKCGTILTKEDINAEFCRQMENVIDDMF
jgi:hypothetical protein